MSRTTAALPFILLLVLFPLILMPTFAQSAASPPRPVEAEGPASPEEVTIPGDRPGVELSVSALAPEDVLVRLSILQQVRTFRAGMGFMRAMLGRGRAPVMTTWHVAGDGTPGGTGTAGDPFGSIQQAIDAAVSGDTIQVQPGTYAENVNLKGKDLLVESTGGPDVTTILSSAGSTVRIANGEGSGAILDGFTITRAETGTFASGRTIGSGSSLIEAIPVDVDGDGDLDVVHTTIWSIAWVENLGGGTFGTPVTIHNSTSNGSVWSVRAADFDGDGDADLVSLRVTSGIVRLHENLGGGAFAAPVDLTANDNPLTDGRELEVADLNGDGNIDIVASGLFEVIWLRALGGGNFATGVVLQVNPNDDRGLGTEIADFDGDGDLDIIAVREPNYTLIRNIGGGNFAAPFNVITSGAWTYPHHAADVDGDGDVDLVSPLETEIHLNNGSGSFTLSQTLRPGGPGWTAWTDDFDGDGDLDLVTSAFSNDTIAWYENVGGGTFGPEQLVDDDVDASRGIRSADFDGDGAPDLLSAGGSENKVQIYDNILATSVTGVTVVANHVIESSFNLRSAIPVDMEGDGDLDVLYIRATSIGWRENDGDGGYGAEIVLPAVGGIKKVVRAGDMDGDGDVDVVYLNIDGQVAWIEQTGISTFATAQALPPTGNTDGIDLELADLDGDGDLDVTSCGIHQSTVWHRNLGNGSFSTPMTIASGGGFSIEVADVDGDGDNDVVASGIPDLVVFKNSGGGSFTATQFVSGVSTTFDEMADFDGDGDIDIASRLGGSFAILTNDGAGSFAQTQSLGDAPGYSISSGDLDGDGDIDVLHDGSSLSVAWRENLGGGTFSAPVALATAYFEPIMFAADLNDDGVPDVLHSGVNTGIGWVEMTAPGNAIEIRNGSSPIIRDCDVEGFDTLRPGAGIAIEGSSPTIEYTVVSGNRTTSALGGGGLWVSADSSPTLDHLTITGNVAPVGGGIAGTASLTSSIDWANSSSADGSVSFTYSDVEGGAAGTGNIAQDPKFVSAITAGLGRGGDFSLQPTSPCIEAGELGTDMGAIDYINQAPYASSGSLSVQEDVAGSGTLNAFDPEGDALLFAISTQPANGTVVMDDPATGAYTFTPDPDFNGSDTFGFTATDGIETSNEGTVYLYTSPVNDAPVANSQTLVFPGGASSTTIQLDGTDVDSSSVAWSIDVAPANGTATVDGNGLVTYTPSGAPSADSFTWSISDGIAMDTAVVTVQVGNTAPVANNSTAEVSEDGTVSGNAQATDPDVGDTLTFNLVTTTQEGVLSLQSSGAFTYTPAADYNGSDSFTFTVSDGQDVSGVGTVSITVASVNDAPVAEIGSVTAPPGTTSIPIVLTATDVEDDFLAYELVSGPANGTLNWNSTENVVYAPNTGFAGTDSFTWRVSDGEFDSNTVTFTINIQNTPPVANATTVVTNEDTPISGNASATDPNANQTLVFALVGNTTDGALALQSSGAFTYTPDADWNGSDSFSFTVSDGEATSSAATVTITVNPVNDAPVATSQSLTIPVGSGSGSVQLDGTDVESSGLAWAVTSQPSNGTVTIDGSGLATFVPATGYSGNDSFQWEANDGELASNVATVSIVVENTAPIADSATFTTAEDTALTGTVTATDPDTANVFTFTQASAPANGNIAFAANGSFTYTPDQDWHGTDGFTFTVSDGLVTSGLGTVTLTVTPVNDAPVANPSGIVVPSAAPNGSIQLVVTDVENDALAYSVVSQPMNGTATIDGNGLATYTPNAGYKGEDSFTYSATDGADVSNVALVEVGVANSPPIASNSTVTVAEDSSVSAAANGVDPNGDAVAFSLLSQPANGTLVFGFDGSFTYTPGADFEGADSFTFDLSDGEFDSDPATVAITVTAVNDVPTATSQSATIDSSTAPLVLALDADDVETVALAYFAASQPSNGTLSIVEATGQATYAPASGFIGVDSFTWFASDGEDNSNVATVTVTVNAVAPSNLVYPQSSAIYTRGQVIPSNVPTADGDAIVSWSISPDITAATGLAFDASSGAISGTASTESGTTSYVITATNTGGSTSATVTVTVNEVAPANLQYASSPAVYTLGAAVTNSATQSGGPAAFSVSPPLPAGLALNGMTGAITGIPSAIAAPSNYTVTASNSGGSTSAVVSITVNDVAPFGLSYSDPVVRYASGTPITPNVPTISGGAVVNWSISPDVSGGLVFDPNDGTISGTPTTGRRKRSHTVTASNSGGSVTASVSILIKFVDVTITGPTDIGDANDPTDIVISGSLDVGSNTLNIHDSDYAEIEGDITMFGGTIAAVNGVRARAPNARFTGYGTIDGPWLGEPGTLITASGGKFRVGKEFVPGWFVHDGDLIVLGGAELDIENVDYFTARSQVILSGGDIITIAGFELETTAVMSGGGRVEGPVRAKPGSEIRNDTGDLTIGGFGVNDTVEINGTVKPYSPYSQRYDSNARVTSEGSWDFSNGGDVVVPNGIEFKGSATIDGGYGGKIEGFVKTEPGTTLTVDGGDFTIGDAAAPVGADLGGTTEVRPGRRLHARAGQAIEHRGTLAVRAMAEFRAEGRTVKNRPGGRIKGKGKLRALKLENRGHVSPGDSPGELTIEGIYQQEAEGVTEMEIAGTATADVDRLVLDGDVILNGTLEVVLLDGFVPEIGDSFQLFDYLATVNGAFAQLVLPMLPSDRIWSTDALYTTGTISVIHPDVAAPTAAVLSPADEAIVNTSTITVQAQIDDESEATVQFSLNGTATGSAQSVAAPGGQVSQVFNLIEGDNEIVVTATDAFGNVGGTGVTVVLDTAAPQIAVTSPSSGTVLGTGPATLALSYQDVHGGQITVQRDGSTTVESITASAGTFGATVDVELVEGANTITIAAIDEAGNASQVSHVIVLDSTAPMITIDSPASDACFGPGESPIAVIATVNDMSATSVTSNPTGIAASLPAGGGIATGAVPLAEGPNTIEVIVSDGGGNTSSSTVTVLYDTTAPSLAITSPADGDTVRGDIEIDVDVTDATSSSPGTGVTLEYFLDGSTTPLGTDAIDTTTLVDGAHTVTVVATDGKGNQSTDTISVSVDNTAPAVTLSSLSGAIVGGTVIFQVDASDGDTGLDSMQLFFGDDGSAPAIIDEDFGTGVSIVTRTASQDTTGFADGDITVKAVVTDNIGNETIELLTVEIDNSAPTKSILSPCQGQRVTGTITIQAQVNDPNFASMTLQIDGNTVAVSTSPSLSHVFDTRSRVDGRMHIKLIATDAAGNESDCAIKVRVDNMWAFMTPRVLNLRSKRSRGHVHSFIYGPNLELLMPTDGKLEIKVPGGNAVPVDSSWSGDDCLSSTFLPGIKRLVVRFSRKKLINSIRAGIQAGKINPNRPVKLKLRVPNVGGAVIQTLVVRIRGC